MPVDLLRDGLLRIPEGAETTITEELSSWISAQSDPAEPGSAAPSGPCEVCQQRDAGFTCVNCSKKVCATDHWVMLGLCRVCVSEDEMRKAREARERARPDLGIKWVED